MTLRQKIYSILFDAEGTQGQTIALSADEISFRKNGRLFLTGADKARRLGRGGVMLARNSVVFATFDIPGVTAVAS
jgi:hypothetical protein